MSDGVHDYGWRGAEGPHSCGYIAPKILEILGKQANIRRVCDLGSGNGALAGALCRAGYEVCGVEYDKEGCRIAREEHPGLHFYNLGVQDSPKSLVDQEGKFDVIISTEVIEHLFSPHLLPRFAYGCLERGGAADCIYAVPWLLEKSCALIDGQEGSSSHRALAWWAYQVLQ